MHTTFGILTFTEVHTHKQYDMNITHFAVFLESFQLCQDRFLQLPLPDFSTTVLGSLALTIFLSVLEYNLDNDRSSRIQSVSDLSQKCSEILLYSASLRQWGEGTLNTWQWKVDVNFDGFSLSFQVVLLFVLTALETVCSLQTYEQ